MYNRNCGNHHNKQVQENMYNRKLNKEDPNNVISPLQAYTSEYVQNTIDDTKFKCKRETYKHI